MWVPAKTLTTTGADNLKSALERFGSIAAALMLTSSSDFFGNPFSSDVIA